MGNILDFPKKEREALMEAEPEEGYFDNVAAIVSRAFNDCVGEPVGVNTIGPRIRNDAWLYFRPNGYKEDLEERLGKQIPAKFDDELNPFLQDCEYLPGVLGEPEFWRKKILLYVLEEFLSVVATGDLYVSKKIFLYNKTARSKLLKRLRNANGELPSKYRLLMTLDCLGR